jgi:peptide/nickel transport system substrate-binding protein
MKLAWIPLRRLKAVSALLLAILLGSLLIACGDNTATTASQTTAAATSTTAAAASTTAPGATTSAAATSTTVAATTGSTATTAATSTTAAAVTPKGGTFTLAIGNAPANLDPSSGEASNEYYFTPAYDSLINYDYDGQYKPLLATAWKWVGNDYKTFEMTLRPNVKYSDGSAFDANVVKGWLELQKTKKTPVAANIGLDSAEVIDSQNVRLHLAAANPLLPLFLSRTWLSGVIPCPAAVANQDILKTATCGVGPYVLDAANTKTGDTYTYVPNPNYWNPSAIYWQKLVFKVTSTPQAGLDAIRSGQAQVQWPADPSLIDTAVAAGKKTVGVDQNILGLDFLFKNGQVVPALKDVRVRQALNYALDRNALAKVLNAGKGTPTSEQALPGTDGYDETLVNMYPYDVNKAKQLLKDAGYANGFDLTILSVPLVGLDTLAQAVASYWKAIGVNVKIDGKTAASDFFAGLTSGKYGVSVAALGATNPTLLAWNCCFHPGSAWNPDTTAVPELQSIIDKLSVSTGDEATATAKQFTRYVSENAWFVPVVSNKLNYLYDPAKVTVPNPTGVQPVINIVDIKPAL